MNRLFILILLLTAVSAGPRNRLHKERKVRLPHKSTQDQGVRYRLPDNIAPTHYNVEITVNEDSFTTSRFYGVSTINILVKETTSTVYFHARNMNISDITLTQGDVSLNVTWSGIGDVTNTVILLSETDLIQDQEYLLSIEYQGVLSRTLTSGFYQSTYVYEGVRYTLGSTDFEPLNARRAFPSFDEPALKATFDFTFIVPSYLNVLFNTRVLSSEPLGTDAKRITFETTPVMSTYLIAFVVSEFTCTAGEPADGTPTEVCSRPGTEDLRALAVDTAPRVLSVMQNYTGWSYSKSQVGKVSQTSIPDYDSGAMENWGLAIYREVYLLWDPEESTDQYKQYVVTIVAHELSHYWFGDLVTLDWWTDVFLNEGFATYFEFYAADELYPDWELPKQFAGQELQAALDSDSYPDSWPLSYYVEAPADISNKFDDISYDKGGSILRMVRYFLGLDIFKLSLTNYINKNQFSIGTPTSLWESFEDYIGVLSEPQKLPATLTEVMQNWTYKAGYPLLTVTSDGDDVIISQNQFLLYDTSDTEWYVPVTYTLSGENSEETTTRAWLVPGENLTLPGVLSNSDWIVLNNEQIGYYRVDYDDNLWQRIFEALSKPDFDGIGAINRAQIADDFFNFARAGRRNYSEVLDVLKFLENDSEYYAWYSSFYIFNYLLRYVGDADLLASLRGVISQLLVRLYESVPFEEEKPEDHIYTLKQILATSWACSLNNEDCVSNSKARFADYRENDVKPSRNLKSVIYCNALRYSDDAPGDFDFLWSKYLLESQLPSEQEIILSALGCTTDEEVLKQYLLKTIDENGGIRRQDAWTVYSGVYSRGTHGINAAFDFITSNYEEITEYFGGIDDLYNLLYYVTNRFTTAEQMKKLEDFIQDTSVDRDLRVWGAETYAYALQNLAFTNYLEGDLKNNYFNGKI